MNGYFLFNAHITKLCTSRMHIKCYLNELVTLGGLFANSSVQKNARSTCHNVKNSSNWQLRADNYLVTKV